MNQQTPKNPHAQAMARLSHAGPPSEARRKASQENGKKGGRTPGGIMRMKLTEQSANCVAIEYPGDDDYGRPKRITRWFRVAVNGGYVREQLDQGEECQACEQLEQSGNTLEWYPGSERFPRLVDLIRYEYNRRMAAMKQESKEA